MAILVIHDGACRRPPGRLQISLLELRWQDTDFIFKFSMYATEAASTPGTPDALSDGVRCRAGFGDWSRPMDVSRSGR